MSEVWYVDLIDPRRVISRDRTVARAKRPEDAAVLAAAPEMLEALVLSLPVLRAVLIGRGQKGGSCGRCLSTWLNDDETHREGCCIAAVTSAISKASGL